ncbi:MAG: ABC transporter permease [Gammaproteobacteria bacterium]|nr:ABC transporter permease [Gammaproteobacteria bacterium]
MYLYIRENVKANLKADISRNYLGLAWWLLEPVLLVLVFYLVFGLLFQRGGEYFVQILVVGIVSWVWFASTVTRSTTSIYSARFLLAQVYLPKYVLPVTVILEGLIRQIFVIAVLIVFLVLTSGMHGTWVWLPVIMMVQLLLVSAVSLWVAAIVPIIPDLKFAITAGLQALMFCSGVFFRTMDVPEKYQAFLFYNPIANIIAQYRSVLVDGSPPDIVSLVNITLISVFFSVMAIVYIKKFDLEYPRLVS